MLQKQLQNKQIKDKQLIIAASKSQAKTQTIYAKQKR